jgi:hypothetical protein
MDELFGVVWAERVNVARFAFRFFTFFRLFFVFVINIQQIIQGLVYFLVRC